MQLSFPIIHKSFVLLSCTFLGLICGTLYLYSSYSPQLASRLGYTVTHSSSIALAGTIGIALAGPIAGIIVDKSGFSKPLLFGGFLVVSSYFFLKLQYDKIWSSVPFSSFLIFNVGFGSTFINSACLKCCAVTFPSIRGVATALPLSLYGLSALFYSTTASIFFPGKISEFLGFLFGSCIIIFGLCAPSIIMMNREYLLNKSVSKVTAVDLIEMTSLSSVSSPGTPRTRSRRAHGVPKPGLQVTGASLLRSSKFWLIFFITGLLASLGQMYIYSVGYMVKALITHDIMNNSMLDGSPPKNLDEIIQTAQQHQVGLLSMTNCLGRILAGILGDIITQTFNLPRVLLLFIPSIGFLVVQIASKKITEYYYIYIISVSTGFFYGFTFCIVPIVVGDIFGMDNFSFNWGVVCLAPILPSFLLTRLFGEIFDSHIINTNANNTDTCLLGTECYDSIFTLTIGVATTVLILTLASNYLEMKSKFKRIVEIYE